MPVTDIIHVNVKTPDLEATDKFYTDVLGMTRAKGPDGDHQYYFAKF